jgi:hypothetical protein
MLHCMRENTAENSYTLNAITNRRASTSDTATQRQAVALRHIITAQSNFVN